MEIIYAREPLPTQVTRSIFLAGPTPRSQDVQSWRTEALKILQGLNYQGHVFVPEPRDGVWANDYDGQIDWEEAALNQADCILFWLPRDLKDMPGFTTNDEWGFWKSSGKVVFGAPKGAEKVRYQLHYAKQYKIPTGETLAETIQLALNKVKVGRLREGGEAQVPLMIWEQASFQTWWSHQVAAGNTLEGARVLWTFRVGPNQDRIFCWTLKVSVFVKAEKRVKENEFVFGRPDVSSVVLFHNGHRGYEIVLVREFRSPATTFDGFIRELPGGSAPLGGSPFSPQELAQKELEEETGFKIDSHRLQVLHPRQFYGTLSSVAAFVYAAEISEEELRYFKSIEGQARGVEKDTERTYVEIYRLRDLISDPLTDWANLGMILTVVALHDKAMSRFLSFS